jgi:hypothetical protein
MSEDRMLEAAAGRSGVDPPRCMVTQIVDGGAREKRCVLPPGHAEQHDFTTVVHILHLGMPLCRFDLRVPRDWPAGHQWVRIEERAQASCRGCLRKAEETLDELEAARCAAELWQILRESRGRLERRWPGYVVLGWHQRGVHEDLTVEVSGKIDLEDMKMLFRPTYDLYVRWSPTARGASCEARLTVHWLSGDGTIKQMLWPLARAPHVVGMLLDWLLMPDEALEALEVTEHG